MFGSFRIISYLCSMKLKTKINMKKLFAFVVMALMAAGANAQSVVEMDWTQEYDYYYGVWYSDNCVVDVVNGEGLIIESIPPVDAVYWDPQVPIIAHIPELERGGVYQVKFTVNAPVAGDLRLDLCSFDGTGAASDAIIPIEAGIKEYTVDFLDYPIDCTDAMLFYQCGTMPGKHVVTKVQFSYGMNYSQDDICYIYTPDEKVAEVTSNPVNKYRGAVEIPSQIMHDGEQYAVTTIGGYAFSNCKDLTSVTIPEGVTTIGDKAFNICKGLTSITIPNSVTYIGENAFSNCNGLTSVTIPNKVTEIGKCAFYGCSNLTSLTIGENVLWISSEFVEKCQRLTDVYCLAESVPYTNYDVFINSNVENATLHVPAASLDDYKNAESWKNFKHIVALNADNLPKCARPVITYNNGEITFSCETEGVEFISEVRMVDNGKESGNKVTLGNTYKVSVYAAKAGYNNSDVETIEIVGTGGGIKGDLNDDGKVNVADHVVLSDIIMQKTN